MTAQKRCHKKAGRRRCRAIYSVAKKAYVKVCISKTTHKRVSCKRQRAGRKAARKRAR